MTEPICKHASQIFPSKSDKITQNMSMGQPIQLLAGGPSGLLTLFLRPAVAQAV